MRWPCRSIALGLLVVVAFGLGCGSPGPGPSGSAGGSGIAEYDPAKLPALDEPFGPLDDGRLKVAPPKGWFTPSRSSKYLVRFQATQSSTYPTVIVTGEDEETIFEVTAENVAQFAAKVAAGLQKEGAELTAPVKPVKVGNRYATVYERTARSGRNYLERMLLDTVVGGRRYTVELRALEGTLSQYRGYGLAVLAGIEFTRSATEGSAGESPAATEPSAPSTPQPATSAEEPTLD